MPTKESHALSEDYGKRLDDHRKDGAPVDDMVKKTRGDIERLGICNKHSKRLFEQGHGPGRRLGGRGKWKWTISKGWVPA